MHYRAMTSRPWVALVLALAAAAAMLPVPSASAAADEIEGDWILRTDPVVVRREGVRYRMRIEASRSRDCYYDDGPENPDCDDWDTVTVRLRAIDDPAGQEKAVETFAAAYEGDVNRDRFRWSTALDAARVETGRMLGPDGAVSLRFRATGGLERDCDGYGQRRRGTVSGAIRVETRSSEIGVITEAPTTATLLEQTEDCRPPDRWSCHGDHTWVSVHRDDRETRHSTQSWRMEILRVDARNSATVAALWREQESLWRHDGAESTRIVNRDLRVTLPSSRVVIPTDLSRLTVRGSPGTQLTGTARGAFSHPQGNTGASVCGSRGFVTTGRIGDVTGDLRAHFRTGPDFRLERKGLWGSVFRTEYAN